MIVPLRPDDLDRIWLVPETHFTLRSLRQHLETYPHLAFTVPASGDYIVGGYWKGRPAIGHIMESSPSSHRMGLVQRLLESYKETGSELAILSEREAHHALRLYLDLGFDAIEDVVCYHKPDMEIPATPHRLTTRRLQAEDLPALVALEQATFNWLWWETAATFQRADERPDSRILLAYLNDELVGYLILAVHGAWGHVNRIAIHPSHQGQGLGRELLAVAISELARRGARSVGLNTQRSNIRSQRLYEEFGFVRTGESLKLYGRWLGARSAPQTTSGG